MFSDCTSLTTIPKLDTSNGTKFNQMFYKCKSLTTIPKLNTSNGTRFESMFYRCKSLTTIPELDTSNGTNFGYMFSDCTSLTTIPKLDVSKGTNIFNIFTNCSALENIVIEGVIGNNISFSSSPLTKESITSVINALSTTATGKTLTLKKTAVNEAFGIDVDDETTYPEGSEFYTLRHSRDNWTFSYA